LDSLAPQPEPFSGISLSVLGLEINLVSGVSPVHVEDVLGVGAGSNPPVSLVVSEFSPSISPLVFGPSLKSCSSLGFRNRLDIVSIPEEGVFSGGIPCKQEGSKELSSFGALFVLRSAMVEGGVGDEVEGLGPLSILPLAVELDRVKSYYKLIGVSCDQFEDKLLTLFELIEAKWADSLAMVPTGSGVKGQREIKRLDCSINYDKKGEQSYRRRGKGRGLFGVNEA
jgi:hypothetical protein